MLQVSAKRLVGASFAFMCLSACGGSTENSNDLGSAAGGVGGSSGHSISGETSAAGRGGSAGEGGGGVQAGFGNQGGFVAQGGSTETEQGGTVAQAGSSEGGTVAQAGAIEQGGAGNASNEGGAGGVVQIGCATGTWGTDADDPMSCIPWSECSIGSFVARPGSATSDRQCSACSEGQTSTVSNATACSALCQHGGQFVKLANGDADCVCPSNTWGAFCEQTTVQLAADDTRSSCALKSDRTVVCWGRNWDGEANAPGGTFASISDQFL